MRLGEIGMRIGIFSSIFGVVYGSVFGNEELLNPLYKTVFGLSEKPVEVMTSNFIPVLLVMAVGLGAILIVISIGINLYLQIKNKNYGELFFSQNGVAGLVFYISLIGGGAYQLMSGTSVITNPIFAVIFLLVPLVLIFLKEALERKMDNREMFPDGFGGFFVESFFELFEICLSFITNTISYLRVGGFVLSHAGMMMAVMLIMDMAGGAGWIVLILGNIFVMCLEGMIVGIQVLRLEFYEMFSRYFTGNGIVFKSLND